MPDPQANAKAGMPVNHDFAVITTPDGPMVMFCAYPDGPGPFPPAVVISGQPGPSSPEITAAEILANQGYVGCTFDLMHRGPAVHQNEDQVGRRRNLTDPGTIADMNAGLDHLKSLPFVQSDNIGIVGFCMGGRVAYMMAGARHDIGAICSLYGSGIYEGYDRPAPIEFTDKIECPVLILNGDKDRVITPEEALRVADTLKENGKTVETHIYPGIGHAWMAVRGSKETYDDSILRSIAWLDKYIGQNKPALNLAPAVHGGGH